MQHIFGGAPTIPKEWPEWVDSIGQTYSPGDAVAISITSGNSSDIVVGEVVRINRLRANGDEIKLKTRMIGPPPDGSDPTALWHYQVEDWCTVTIRPIFICGSPASTYDRTLKQYLPVGKAKTYQKPENIVALGCTVKYLDDLADEQRNRS